MRFVDSPSKPGKMAKCSWDSHGFSMAGHVLAVLCLSVAGASSYSKKWRNSPLFRPQKSHAVAFFKLRYLYSGSPTAMAGLSFGYGIGLPLSRLHAKYLGGSLDLVSLPGYGVDVTGRKIGKASKGMDVSCGCCGTVGWKQTKNLKMFPNYKKKTLGLKLAFSGDEGPLCSCRAADLCMGKLLRNISESWDQELIPKLQS